MSLWRKLGTHTAVYGLSSIIGRLINWALTPLYSNYFSLEEFGIFSDLYALTFYPLILLTFGMETSFFHFAGKKIDFEKTYAHAFMVVGGLNGLFLLICGGGYSFIAESLGYGLRPELILMLVGIIILDTLAALPMARLRFLERSRWFAFISLTNIFFTLAFNVLLIVVWKMGISAVLVSNLIASSIKLGLALWGNFPKQFTYDKTTLKPIFWYGFYIMLAGLAGAVNETFDRNLLPRLWGTERKAFMGYEFNGMEMNGIYSAMYKLGMFISLITQAFRYAAEPFFFKEAGEKSAPETYAKVFHYFTTLCLIAFLLVASTAREIVAFDFFGQMNFTLIPQRYWVGLDVVPIILLANVCLAMYVNLSVWYKITAQLRYGLFISVMGAVLTIVINAVAIPYIGYYGSALATLVCYGSMCIFCYQLGKKQYPIPYRFKRLILYSLMILFFFCINRFLELKGLSGMNITLFKIFLCILCAGMIGLYERQFPTFAPKKSVTTEL